MVSFGVQSYALKRVNCSEPNFNVWSCTRHRFLTLSGKVYNFLNLQSRAKLFDSASKEACKMLFSASFRLMPSCLRLPPRSAGSSRPASGS